MTDKWLTLNEIAFLMNLKKDSVKKWAQRKKWPYRSYTVRGGRERRYHLANLPEDVQTAYAASIKTSLEDLRNQLKPALKTEKKINIPRYSGRGAGIGEVRTIENTPEEYLRVAAARRKVLEAYSASGLTAAQFVTAWNSGVAVPELRGQLGAFGEISSQSSLYRWLERYEQFGLAGLAPQYSRRRGGSGASLDERARDLIQALYLDPHKPSIRTVERDIRQFGYALNYSIINRYINNEIPLSVKTFYRMGEKAYHDRFDPYIPRDYTLFQPMEWVVADHKTFDFIGRVDDRRLRFYLTLVMDMRSRKILGWHIDQAPNTLTILRAICMMVDSCGTPLNMLVDNGKDFRSHWLVGDTWKERRMKLDKESCDLTEGILGDIGCKAHFCNPYRGQSKPVERLFRTIIELFEKRQSTYAGSNTADRPDETKLYWGNFQGREQLPLEYFPTLEIVRQKFAEFVAWYNAEWEHSGQGMDGKTPDQVFAENAVPRRDIPENIRKYIFTRREIRTPDKNGVTIDGIQYYNEKIVQYIGQQVEVRRDINNIGRVSIFSLPDRLYLFDAENQLKDFGITEENIRLLKKKTKAARNHLSGYAKNAGEIRQAAKSPAELYAEEARKVVGGEPITGDTPPVISLANPDTKPAKRKIKGIFDVP
jgi:transposase InsO family protein